MAFDKITRHLYNAIYIILNQEAFMKLTVTKQQQLELREVARKHPAAYVRMKALALLNVEQGRTIVEVAKIFMASRQSIYIWIERYLAFGIEGLKVQIGRGRKAKAKPQEIEQYILQSPRNFGLKQSRWTLKALAEVVPSLCGFSASGVKRALARAGFSYKRGQPVQHSPDPEYAEKKSGSKKL
jgi:transposase